MYLGFSAGHPTALVVRNMHHAVGGGLEVYQFLSRGCHASLFYELLYLCSAGKLRA